MAENTYTQLSLSYFYVNMVKTGIYKIPEIQKQYSKAKDELEVIEYKRVMSKHELENMNNLITILNRDIYNKRNEIAYLHFEVRELEGYIHGLNNHNQQQEIQNE